MRVRILNTLAGALGLAAVAASAPAPLGTSEDCTAPGISTVFVTAPTVYVTLPASSISAASSSEMPTTTVTHWATLTSTTTAYSLTEYVSVASSSSVAGEVHAGSPYDSTITQIATITITNVNLTPFPSGGYVTYTETPAPNGLLNYVVENGTTYWLDGQTPAPGESYVYSTSSIIVEPIYASDPVASSEEATSTLTIQSTLYVTAKLTLTETLSTATSSSSQTAVTSASAGTALPYVMSSGGWNATKTSSVGGVLSGMTVVSSSTAGGFLANTTPTLLLYPSLNIYETSHSTITKSSLAAESGFNVFTTPASGYTNASTTSFDPTIATSSAKGALTTAGLKNHTSTESCTESSYLRTSTGALYANSTFATSVGASSGASGALTSLASSSSSLLYGSPSARFNSTSASSSASVAILSSTFGYISSPHANTSTAASSALGALTSLSTSSASYDPTGAISSSILGYTASSQRSISTATSSAIGVVTSATYDPSSSILSSILGYASSSLKAKSSTPSSSALGVETSLTSSTKLTSSFSVGSYSYPLPIVSSTASSSALGGLTSLISTTSDDCTEPTIVSSSATSSTASSSVAGALTSSASKLSSTSSSRGYASSSPASTSTPGSTYTASTSPPLYSSNLKPSSTLTTKTSTDISSSAYATPTKCGEQGDFVLNFDDIPPLVFGNETESEVAPEPVFNPYHQFDFSDGFVVVPPPIAKYNPSSSKLFVEFIPNFNINGNNTQAGPNTAEEGYMGQISDGDFDETGCFRFNVYGAAMGCDSTGPACDFNFAGYQLDSSRNEVLIASQTKAVPACPTQMNCQLTEVDLDNNFVNLAFIRINVTVAGQPKIWWMDDLRMGWFDNSCAKGLCRIETPVH